MSPDFSLHTENPEKSPAPQEIKQPVVEIPKNAEQEKPQEQETVVIKKEQPKEGEVSFGQVAPPPSPVAQSSQQPAAKSASLLEVEKILEEHLGDLYARIPDKDKSRFLKTGEETAKEIDGLLNQAKVKVKKILSLIAAWLKLIPGVSKFFIEQEAELKTNKLLALKEKEKNEQL
jgi:hypothetical protein